MLLKSKGEFFKFIDISFK